MAVSFAMSSVRVACTNAESRWIGKILAARNGLRVCQSADMQHHGIPQHTLNDPKEMACALIQHIDPLLATSRTVAGTTSNRCEATRVHCRGRCRRAQAARPSPE